MTNFALEKLSSEEKNKLTFELTKLPSVIRYLDDFSESWYSIHDPEESDIWPLSYNGIASFVDFNKIPASFRRLSKLWIWWLLSRLSPATAHMYSVLLYSVVSNDVILRSVLEMLKGGPLCILKKWDEFLASFETTTQVNCIKSLMRFMCEFSLGEFSPSHIDFVGNLKGPTKDKYAGIRSGDVFLSVEEESSIIGFLDNINSEALTNSQAISTKELISACIVCIAYQYAMRPIQIAKVRLSDVRIYDSGEPVNAAVHITFYRAKQRTSGKRLPMVRRVKREWVPIFIEMIARRKKSDFKNISRGALPDALFGLSPVDIGNWIQRKLEDVTGAKRSANELRHSAAQRLVDAGASEIELADFMGHSYADTGLVYFQASIAQAERVNKAMAISTIYSNLSAIAHTRTIDKSKLLNMPPEHHIAAVPHGIPIAGIGACELKQSICKKNPVLSCYNCHKFLAVSEVDVHRNVLKDMRAIVRQFFDESRGDSQSPAYLQLRNTMNAIQSVVVQLEGGSMSDE